MNEVDSILLEVYASMVKELYPEIGYSELTKQLNEEFKFEITEEEVIAYLSKPVVEQDWEQVSKMIECKY